MYNIKDTEKKIGFHGCSAVFQMIAFPICYFPLWMIKTTLVAIVIFGKN